MPFPNAFYRVIITTFKGRYGRVPTKEELELVTDAFLNSDLMCDVISTLVDETFDFKKIDPMDTSGDATDEDMGEFLNDQA